MPAIWSFEPSLARLSRRLVPPRFNSDWVEVNRVSLTLPRLAPEFHGYRLVHISDLHTDVSLTRAHLAHLVELINQQQPDVVVITGDFVSYDLQPHLEDIVATLCYLAPRDVTVAVLGNHDYWVETDLLRQALWHCGIVDLSNAVYTVCRGEAMFHLAGVDDVWEDQHQLDQVLAQLPSAGAAVLLAHEPDFADVSAATGRFDLQLSGHTHGGQVIIPGWGPIVIPPYGLKYPMGHYQVGSMSVYTNRGLGESSIRLRINCSPEITVFTLHAPEAGDMGQNKN